MFTVDTFLSKEVEYYIKFPEKNYSVNNINYISDEFTLNWDDIEAIFYETPDNFVIHNENPEWFHNKLSSIYPILHESTKILDISEHNLNLVWEKCSWTNHTENIKQCLQYLSTGDEIKLLEAHLILTTIIERSLGDLYLIENKTVPFLLRDLLETEYLYKLLGKTAVRFLQILVGTSKSVNLRNVAWHGFFASGELKIHHVTIFIVILASIGCILESKNILPENIPYRSEVINFNENICKILYHNNFVEINNHQKDLLNILRSTPFIGHTHIKFWEKIVEYTIAKNVPGSIILFLPQFEHLLRRIYCEINSFPERCVTAETKEMYITLDNVFAQKLNDNQPNKLFEILDCRAIEIYEDLFSQLSGPRVRDKISHGEKYLNDITENLMKILLNLTVYIVTKVHVILNISYEIENYKLLADLYRNITNYRSVYHPNAILKFNILESYDDINHIIYLPKPNDVEYFTKDTEVINFFKSVEKKCLRIFVGKSKSQMDFKEIVKKLDVPTVNRPKFELKCVKRMTKIATVLSDISAQILNDAHDRFEAYENHVLSSRQRDKYPEILEITELIYSALHVILYVMVANMFTLFQIDDENYSSRAMFRFLLYLRKYEDKILMLIDVKKNKWQTAKTLTYEFHSQLLNYCKNL